MKALKYALVLVLALSIGYSASAQLDKVKGLGKKVVKEATDKQKTTGTEKPPAEQQAGEEALPSSGEQTGSKSMGSTPQEEPSNIVFSKMPVDPANPGQSVTEFQAGDAIYALVLLDKTLQDIYEVEANKKVDVGIFLYEITPPKYDYQEPQEMQIVYVKMQVSGEYLQKKYLPVEIAPEPDKATSYVTPGITYTEFGKKFDGPVNITETFSKFEPGKHQLKMKLNCNYKDVASGKFSISGGDFKVYKGISERLNQGAQSAGAQNATMPKALMTDADLEAKMIAAFKNSNDWKSGFIDATEVLKIAILDADWYIRRHEISGEILHRYIRAAIAVKTKSGQCAYYNLVTFQEDYLGGKFQPLKYDGTGDKVMMDCNNLNK
jgi:hypothetical protein